VRFDPTMNLNSAIEIAATMRKGHKDTGCDRHRSKSFRFICPVNELPLIRWIQPPVSELLVPSCGHSNGGF
jgi:hypothetical protein